MTPILASFVADKTQAGHIHRLTRIGKGKLAQFNYAGYKINVKNMAGTYLLLTHGSDLGHVFEKTTLTLSVLRKDTQS